MDERFSGGDVSGDKETNNMTPIGIPDGVNRYKNESQGETAVCQYGLEKAFDTSVPTFRKESEDQTESVDGRVLNFQPGDFLVYVTKRDLAAEEINHIGQLVAELDTKYKYRQYLVEAIKQLEGVLRLTKPLQLSQLAPEYVIGDGENANMADGTINKDFEGLGIIANRMRERLPKLDAYVKSIKISLRDLGVSLVRCDGPIGSAFPVGKE